MLALIFTNLKHSFFFLQIQKKKTVILSGIPLFVMCMTDLERDGLNDEVFNQHVQTG